MWLVHCLCKARCTVHVVEFMESTYWIVGNPLGHDRRIDKSKTCVEKGSTCANTTCTPIGMEQSHSYSSYSSFSQAGDKILEPISTLLAITKTNQTPLRMMSLLDVAISVLIRLKGVSDEPSHRLPQDLKVGTFHGSISHSPLIFVRMAFLDSTCLQL